jgi:hypothetical protein
MMNKVNKNSELQCNICNKVYASKSSLCNHNKKFHNHMSPICQPMSPICQPVSPICQLTEKINKIKCDFCNKEFNTRQSKSKHKKKCTENNKFKEIEEQNKQLMQTINELKNQVSMILKEKGKIHHKTLQKINNQLNVNQSNNINNGSIINNTYVKFGELEYEKILNNNQIKHILNKQYKCLEESIKQIHFNEDIPEYNNVFITNMKDDIAYVFNGKQFISIRKNEMLNDLIDTHIKEINLSLEKNKNTLNEKYVTRLEKFLDMLNDDDTKFTDHDNQRTYNSYKAYKINSIKLLIYNESDKKKFELLNNMELEEKLLESDIDSNY